MSTKYTPAQLRILRLLRQGERIYVHDGHPKVKIADGTLATVAVAKTLEALAQRGEIIFTDNDEVILNPKRESRLT